MKNIVLIGSGQLGSRHLQGLALVKQKVKIQVIDASLDALNIAEARFKEVSENFTGEISFHTEIKNIEKKIDIVIIATNSKVRRVVLEQLLVNSSIDYLILEKVLFTNEEDYQVVENIIEKNNIKAWVNCARRMMDFYKDLQKELSGSVHFMATGNAWGLGCNGIHLLDLFAYLTKDQNIILSNQLIDKTVLESKRPGYIEFTGTITGRTDKHSFHITSFPNGSSPIHIVINTPTVRYSIQEGSTGKVWISKLENAWSWEEQTFTMPFQSQLTNRVVGSVLETGTCDLTSFKESSVLHLLFLRNLISFLQNINSDNTIKECLIT